MANMIQQIACIVGDKKEIEELAKNMALNFGSHLKTDPSFEEDRLKWLSLREIASKLNSTNYSLVFMFDPKTSEGTYENTLYVDDIGSRAALTYVSTVKWGINYCVDDFCKSLDGGFGWEEIEIDTENNRQERNAWRSLHHYRDSKDIYEDAWNASSVTNAKLREIESTDEVAYWLCLRHGDTSEFSFRTFVNRDTATKSQNDEEVKYVKVHFPDGKKYSYFSKLPVSVGDKVMVPGKMEGIEGEVVEIIAKHPKGRAASYTLYVKSVVSHNG